MDGTNALHRTTWGFHSDTDSKQMFEALFKWLFSPFLPLLLSTSQDSAEDVEEAGALSKLPGFGASAAEGVAEASEKDGPPGESASAELESQEPDEATGSEPASATEGNDTEVTSENESAPSAALGESALEPRRAETAPADSSAKEPKRITYSQIVREGRRFNIDLVSKVGTEWHS